MKRLAIILSVIVLSVPTLSAQTDSARYAALDQKLDEYFAAMIAESVSVQDGECDFLISSCTDSLVKQHVALYIYNHFLNSKVMGLEGVAVYVTDNWFIPGKVKMLSGQDLFTARIFADFNRESLLGMRAPSLRIRSMDGASEVVPDSSGRYKVLFFYSTDCATCKIETALMKGLFQQTDYPVDFYAIYVGTDQNAWMRYAMQQFAFNVQNTRILHFADIDSESDMIRQYGVLKTPRVFLLDPSNVIIGRGLGSNALGQLLKSIFSKKDYVYGSDESKTLFDRIFAQSGDSLQTGDIAKVASQIESATLSKGDTLHYKELTGDLLYYLSSQRKEAFKMASGPFASRYILERDDVWRTQDDSLKVVSLAQMMNALMQKSPVGEMVPDIKVSGILKTSRNTGTARTYSLRKLKGSDSLVMFYTVGCGNCETQMTALDSLLSQKGHRGMKVLLVNMDELFSSYPDQAQAALDAFDLSALPYITELSRKGIVLRKYLNL